MYFISCLLVLVMQLVSFQTFASKTGLYFQVASTTIPLRGNDIEQIQMFQSEPEKMVAMIKLRSAAAANIHKLTEKNIGERALWIWNGRVLCTQKLEAPLDENIIIHRFTFFEAEDFSKHVGRPIH
jgi:hypothetical protein